MNATILRSYFLDRISEESIDFLFNGKMVPPFYLSISDRNNSIVAGLNDAKRTASLLNYHTGLIKLVREHADQGLTGFSINTPGTPRTAKSFAFLIFDQTIASEKVISQLNKKMHSLAKKIDFPDRKTRTLKELLLNICSDYRIIHNTPEHTEDYLNLALGPKLYPVYTSIHQQKKLQNTIKINKENKEHSKNRL